MLQAKKLVT